MNVVQRASILTVVVIAVMVVLADDAAAQRIRDLARVEGERHRQLQGIGLVVGLTGTGDGQQNLITKKFLLKMIQNSGNFPEVTLDDLKSRNVALVEVTASVPTSLRVGSEFEVAVSSIGDSESLRGGSLIGVPLRGPGVVKGENGLIQFENYALAHGSVFSEDEGEGKLTVGKAKAILEKRMYGGDLFTNLDEISLILLKPDFGTAYRVESKINQHDLFRDPTAGLNAPLLAKALDSSSVSVRIPTSYLSRNRVIDFISQVMEIEVPEVDREALVAINRKTGSVVNNGAVRVAASATISYNNVFIRVPAQLATGDPNDSNGNPFDRNPLLIDVIKVLNLEDFSGSDVAHILRQLHRVGAINGKFVEE